MKNRRLALWIGIPLIVLLSGGAGLWFYGRPLVEKVIRESMPEIQTRLTQAAGFPIHLERLTLDHEGIRPVLRADHVSLGIAQEYSGALTECDPGAAWSIGQIEIRFDLWRALIERKIELTRLTAHALKGAVAFDSKLKKWSSPPLGLPRANEATSNESNSFLQALAALGALELMDIELCALQGDIRRTLSIGSLKLSSSSKFSGDLEIQEVAVTSPEYPDLKIPELRTHWVAQTQGLKNIRLELSQGHLLIRKTRFDFEAGLGPNTSTDLTILAELKSAVSFAELRKMLPRGLIPRTTDTFLASAVLGAELTGGKLRVQGDQWAVKAQARNVGFQFDENWPTVEKAQLVLDLDNQNVRFEVPQAESLGVPVSEARGEIKNDLLTLSLKAKPDQAALLAWIEKGPFREWAPQVLKTLRPLSGSQLQVDAKIPMSEDDQKPTEASIRVDGLKLQVTSPLQEDIDELQSQLKIETHGQSTQVQWSKTSGKLEGGNWSSEGRAELSSAKNGRSQIDAKWSGTLPWRRLKELFPQLSPFPAKGEVPLEAKVELTRAGSDPSWHFETQGTSSLLGLELDGPAPLRKTASESWESRFEAIGSDESIEGLTIETPPLEARVRWLDGALHTQSRLTAQAFKIETWRDWWNQNSQKWNKSEVSPAAQHDVELTAGTFAFHSQLWHNARINLHWSESEKKLRVTAKEAVGDVIWDGAGKDATLKVRFDPLQIQPPESQTTKSATPNSESETEPMDWGAIPELHAFIENLSYGNERLGTLKIETKKGEQRLDVTLAELRGAHMIARIERGSQKWGLAAQSNWNGNIVFDDFSHNLRGVKSISGFEIQEGNLQFDLQWPGTWDQWGWHKAKGQIRGRVRRGALLGVKSSGAHLLNLINLNFADNALERVRFNALELRLDLDHGTVSTPKSKCYVGSTFLKLSGKTNLVSDRLEFDALVTPNLTGTTLSRALSLISEEQEQANLERELYQTEPENAFSQTIKIRGTWENPKQD